jgi:8-oxo-dGTP diphosphatase
VSAKRSIDVAIALVWRAGALLISRRRPEQHLGGFWEFPGGKLEPGESALHAAEREVAEEVDVVASAERERAVLRYEYEDRIVTLRPVDCRHVSGEARARQVAEVRWVKPAELATLQFPPANAPLIAELLAEHLH